jgi:DNA (cytosine-5)-methyltransferase 1
MSKLKVIELFAGVGGFHLGLQRASIGKDGFEVVWSNQWEPSTKKQHASLVYQFRFPDCPHTNRDIEEVIEQDFGLIPDHDLLVGGFPCQDYSVATTLRNSKGLRGKKGVLWWSIEAILRKKGKAAPKYLMLENVDRLLISPADQRGRDFAIMLRSLDELEYAVEWRVINAADYGMPQRRRRTFIMAYKKGTKEYAQLMKHQGEEHILSRGLIAQTFPCTAKTKLQSLKLKGDVISLSKKFNKIKGSPSPFQLAGCMIDGQVCSMKVTADYTGKCDVLEDVLLKSKEVPAAFFVSKEDLESKTGWRWQKSAKRIERKSRSGHDYVFTEGSMSFPDPIDRPSRTVITGEGGKTPSRFKHIVEQDGKMRRLTPIELERLNMFPDDHTALTGISDAKRAFFMGNALVVGVVERLGRGLLRM